MYNNIKVCVWIHNFVPRYISILEFYVQANTNLKLQKEIILMIKQNTNLEERAIFAIE